MAKARQQYFADEVTLQKENRDFAIQPELIEKLESIETWAQVNVIETVKVNWEALIPDEDKAVDVSVPLVEDTLYSTNPEKALSAKQWKVLYEYIQNLASRGRYLSNWNAATWLPTTNPTDNPYAYRAWDYYVVSNVAAEGWTNYRPNWVEYNWNVASTTVESEVVKVWDYYTYDGTYWLLLVNTSREIAIDSELSASSTNPVENRVITNALGTKQNTISDLETIRSWAALWATAIQPWDSLSELTWTSDDITQGTTNLFMTTAERSKLSNQSWVNTWDETQITIKNKLWQASTSTDGYLTSTDWNTFNNKQNAISDLETIRSNATAWKNASDTIAEYWRAVYSNPEDFAWNRVENEVLDLRDNLIPAIESDIDTLQDDVTQAQSDITSLDGRVTQNELDIENLNLSMGDMWDDLGDVINRVDVAEWDIESLQQWKQDKLEAWANIQIDPNTNIISATDTKYTAWPWIAISANNVISNTQTSAEWWNITWALSDQTDLQTALNWKQNILTPWNNIEIINDTISAIIPPIDWKTIKVSATSPIPFNEYDFWFDTTHNRLMSFFGSAWSEVNEPKLWYWLQLDSFGNIEIKPSEASQLLAWDWLIDSNNKISVNPWEWIYIDSDNQVAVNIGALAGTWLEYDCGGLSVDFYDTSNILAWTWLTASNWKLNVDFSPDTNFVFWDSDPWYDVNATANLISGGWYYNYTERELREYTWWEKIATGSWSAEDKHPAVFATEYWPWYESSITSNARDWDLCICYWAGSDSNAIYKLIWTDATSYENWMPLCALKDHRLFYWAQAPWTSSDRYNINIDELYLNINTNELYQLTDRNRLSTSAWWTKITTLWASALDLAWSWLTVDGYDRLSVDYSAIVKNWLMADYSWEGICVDYSAVAYELAWNWLTEDYNNNNIALDPSSASQLLAWNWLTVDYNNNNIAIDSTVVSGLLAWNWLTTDYSTQKMAVDTSAIAWSWLTSNNWQLEVDTTTIATKSDLANFAWFKVVATLPTTDIKTNIIYLLWPVGSGADKYEEYIYSNNAWIKIGDTTVDLSPYFNVNTQTSDAITQWSQKLFLTTAERTKLNNTSWTNTWDETKQTIQNKLWAATSSNDWYLTSADWSTFNSKQGALTAWNLISLDNNTVKNKALFVIKESDVTVTTSEDAWVAPYNTSYKYTNITINNPNVEWVEWALYTFIVDTAMVVASAYRNVRVRLWSNGTWIPVMNTSVILPWQSYFIKNTIRYFQYTTKYQSWWAIHMVTDSNTTYSAMTSAELIAWTWTTARTITPARFKEWVLALSPVKSVNWGTWDVALDADSISDFSTTNKFVTTAEKNTWNAKADASDINTKTFTVVDSTSALSAIAYYDNGWNPIVKYNNILFYFTYSTAEFIAFSTNPDVSASNVNAYWLLLYRTSWNISSWTNTLAWWGDMAYADFNWQSKSWATVTLDLASTITPSANFTVNAPSTIKDGQTYILRVNNWATAYTMTLWTNITNPYGTDLTLTAGWIDQFVFLAIGWQLELQPEWWGWKWTIAADTNGTDTEIKYIWAWTEEQYAALWEYDENTAYFTF